MVAELRVTVAAELVLVVVAGRQVPVVAELHVDAVEGGLWFLVAELRLTAAAERFSAVAAELHVAVVAKLLTREELITQMPEVLFDQGGTVHRSTP